MDDGLGPGHGVDVEYVQITEAAAAHAAVNDQLGVGRVATERDGRVRFTRRRRFAESDGQVPELLLSVGRYVQDVQVVQVARYIVLGVFAVVGQTAEQEDAIAVDGEAVAEARARRRSVVRSARLQTPPLPPTRLQFVQLVRVFAVLDHSAEDEDARPVHHEAVCRTSRRYVAFNWRYKPLIGGCNFYIFYK